MATSTTYYAIAGTLARIVRDDVAGMTVDLWSPSSRTWSAFPEILGDLTGAGGDPPADIVAADAAARFLALEPEALRTRLATD